MRATYSGLLSGVAAGQKMLNLMWSDKYGQPPPPGGPPAVSCGTALSPALRAMIQGFKISRHQMVEDPM